MTKNQTQPQAIPGAIIVGLILPQDQATDINENLNELEALLSTLGIETRGRLIQKRQKYVASSAIGSGKIEEVAKLALEKNCQYVVFDHSLSAAQVKNLAELTQCEVKDRAGIILDIFAKHAKTKTAKIQVEIAQLEYMLPRLTGAWSHLGRQTGGGVARGMGEKQIEIDRRRARDRLGKLRRNLKEIEEEQRVQAKSRRRELNVALIGYTNSGKTTLMNALTHAGFLAADKLFATLDTAVRVMDPSTRPRILISDTVGFIKNLPHGLIASFKSTLAQAMDADLLLQVIDLAHPHYQDHMDITEKVLEDIGAAHIPRLFVFNKLDLVEEKFLAKILKAKYPDSITVSANESLDITRMHEWLYDYFAKNFDTIEIKISADQNNLISYIYQNTRVMEVAYLEDNQVFFKVCGQHEILERLRPYVCLDGSPTIASSL